MHPKPTLFTNRVTVKAASLKDRMQSIKVNCSIGQLKQRDEGVMANPGTDYVSWLSWLIRKLGIGR